MESIYKAYTKEINGVLHYFVKKYSIFPEYEGFPEVLDTIGMHNDFYKACDIAKIYDEIIIGKLMKELHIIPESARVIHMHGVKAVTHSLIKNTHQAILKLRLASIN
ncbi:MAG: hypothetical protein ABI185_07170 [Ginsengibacter sp.]